MKLYQIILIFIFFGLQTAQFLDEQEITFNRQNRITQQTPVKKLNLDMIYFNTNYNSFEVDLQYLSTPAATLSPKILLIASTQEFTEQSLEKIQQKNFNSLEQTNHVFFDFDNYTQNKQTQRVLFPNEQLQQNFENIFIYVLNMKFDENSPSIQYEIELSFVTQADFCDENCNSEGGTCLQKTLENISQEICQCHSNDYLGSNCQNEITDSLQPDYEYNLYAFPKQWQFYNYRLKKGQEYKCIVQQNSTSSNLIFAYYSRNFKQVGAQPNQFEKSANLQNKNSFDFIISYDLLKENIGIEQNQAQLDTSSNTEEFLVYIALYSEFTSRHDISIIFQEYAGEVVVEEAADSQTLILVIIIGVIILLAVVVFGIALSNFLLKRYTERLREERRQRNQPKQKVINVEKLQSLVGKFMPVSKYEDYVTKKTNENAPEEDIYKECIICLIEYQLGDTVVESICNHAFHKDCFFKWLEKNDNCPFCRQQFQSEEQIIDYIKNDQAYQVERRKRLDTIQSNASGIKTEENANQRTRMESQINMIKTSNQQSSNQSFDLQNQLTAMATTTQVYPIDQLSAQKSTFRSSINSTNRALNLQFNDSESTPNKGSRMSDYDTQGGNTRYNKSKFQLSTQERSSHFRSIGRTISISSSCHDQVGSSQQLSIKENETLENQNNNNTEPKEAMTVTQN